MLLFFKLALRNLIRNRVRTFLNLTMIIGAFIAIVFFRGFAQYMLQSIEISVTEAQSGHIQIAKQEIWDDNLPKNKSDAYIENHTKIINNLKSVKEVMFTSGRSNAYALIINGDKSVGALAQGYDPKVETSVEKTLVITEGKGFSNSQIYEVLVGAGLQKNLHLKIGQPVTLLSQTLSGSMSSVDLEVRGTIKTGFTDQDNSIVYVPLQVAQKLLGTERVERLTVRLQPDTSLNTALAKVKDVLKSNPDLLAKSWKESSTLFRQLIDFYFIQNTLVEVILACLVFFGILNTLGMSVFERLSELGTMRALGDRNETVLLQLVFEALLLGFIGCIIATPITALLGFTLSSLNIPIMMPGASLPMPIRVEPSYFDYILSGIVVVMTCLLASLWPALKAVRLSIVDALRANS